MDTEKFTNKNDVLNGVQLTKNFKIGVMMHY